jgi:hypothetical protein
MNVTAQKIHALMRKAAVTKSTTRRSGQVRGWSIVSPGYAVVEQDDGFLVYWKSETGPRINDAAAREGQLQRYEAALAALNPGRSTHWDKPCVFIAKRLAI